MDAGTASTRLSVLRAALTALPLEHCLPDVARLSATLRALNPVLSGEACGPPAWVFGTSMPSRDWVARVAELRREALEQPVEQLPDESLVHATALAPELGQRLIDNRRFQRFLQRHPVFEDAQEGLGTGAGRSFHFLDAVLQDGRWGRIRGVATIDGPGGAPEREQLDAWFDMSFGELLNERPGTQLRVVVGPVWRPDDGGEDDFGLRMVVESVQGTERHAAVPAHLVRQARGCGLGTVHSFALPTSTR